MDCMTSLDSVLKSKDITLPTKVNLVKPMVFPAVMYGCELDHKEGWAPKNWCLQIVVLEKTLESPLDYKIKPVNLKGNQPRIFIGRTKAPKLWPPDAKSQLTGKDPDARKDSKRRRGQQRMWWLDKHHQPDRHISEQTPGDSEGQGSLPCCSPWCRKELVMT